MVLIEHNLLDDNDLEYIESLINNFVPDEVPTINGYRNDFFKQKIKLNDNILKKVELTILKQINKKIDVMGIWLNKIDPLSNNDDDFHRDDTNLSFVIYPFNNFKGGELELRDRILPITKNISYILLHNVEHRVKPVIEGIRWSIAIFCQYNIETKSVI